MRIVRKLNGHPAQHKIVAPLQTVFVAFDPGRGHKFTNNIPALGLCELLRSRAVESINQFPPTHFGYMYVREWYCAPLFSQD